MERHFSSGAAMVRYHLLLVTTLNSLGHQNTIERELTEKERRSKRWKRREGRDKYDENALYMHTNYPDEAFYYV